MLQRGEKFEYRGPEAFRGWLYSWTLNKIRDRQKYYARGKRRQDPTRQQEAPPDLDALIHDASETPSQHAMQREDLDRLQAAFDQLPSEQRAVLFLEEIPKGATGKLQRIGLAEKLGIT